jgi:sugar/nucleoside kinase (ribokinase family)
MVDTAIVKTGKNGSLIRQKDETFRIGIVPVVPVDTTGAGDLYAAGFLYGQASGWSLKKSGEAGALLAGNVIEFMGAKMTTERWKTVREQL